MKFERIDHVHLAVRELDQAVPFFEKLLGIKFCPPFDVEKDDLGKDISMRSAFSSMGLEIFAATSEKSSIHRFIESKGEGLHAISFKVDDIDAAIEHLQNQGLKLVGRMTLGQLKEAHFHPKDTFGFMIELCEYPDRCAAYDASQEQ